MIFFFTSMKQKLLDYERREELFANFSRYLIVVAVCNFQRVRLSFSHNAKNIDFLIIFCPKLSHFLDVMSKAKRKSTDRIVNNFLDKRSKKLP